MRHSKSPNDTNLKRSASSIPISTGHVISKSAMEQRSIPNQKISLERQIMFSSFMICLCFGLSYFVLVTLIRVKAKVEGINKLVQ